jgi:tRNA A37 threonylcarbamoyladenosine dehydratase
VVIDRIDSVNAKAADLVQTAKIQVITTGGAGGQIDPTQIQVSDLNSGTIRLPRCVPTPQPRLWLSRTPGATTAPCVYPVSQADPAPRCASTRGLSGRGGR